MKQRIVLTAALIGALATCFAYAPASADDMKKDNMSSMSSDKMDKSGKMDNMSDKSAMKKKDKMSDKDKMKDGMGK
ncbi:MAG TPA: hypothetical protein VHD14_16950 [Pseudolabrys sp.]|jgi:pentapeptide MXKDX repeat protein|nr:hypothetical protein [Pseudolabrys sp.]